MTAQIIDLAVERERRRVKVIPIRHADEPSPGLALAAIGIVLPTVFAYHPFAVMMGVTFLAAGALAHTTARP
jgi:hypothetical protein